MPTFNIRFRSDRPDEVVEADDARIAGAHVELLAELSVTNRPRTIVVRRVLAAEILAVDPVQPGVAPQAEPAWAEPLGPCWPLALGQRCPVRAELLETNEELRSALETSVKETLKIKSQHAGPTGPPRLADVTTIKHPPVPTEEAKQRLAASMSRLGADETAIRRATTSRVRPAAQDEAPSEVEAASARDDR